MRNYESFLGVLRCPDCLTNNFVRQSDALKCTTCGIQYPVVQGCPVLLRPGNELFRQEDYLHTGMSTTNIQSGNLSTFIPSPSVNLSSERVLERVKQMLKELPSGKVLVVGGGRQREWLDGRLGKGDKVNIIYSDIDVTADVDLFCDGHDLPLMDGSFDAVITTAVLEHVLYPERVAAEIHRVLKVGGLLYSELPFMQQVHEGAYDFTRYTLSGHRRLFNGFIEIESGMVAGPGTALVWAIENFALAFIDRPAILRNSVKALVRICFAWLKYFDRFLINRPAAMDGASCTYFLGRRIEGRISDSEIVARYLGAKYLKHT